MSIRFAVLVGAALLVTAAADASAVAADGQKKFKSVDVDLPFGDLAFPPGPGADAINDNCLACHSAEMVLDQPPMPRATWQAEVAKMRTVFAAPIADDDAKRIVDYLARLKGSDASAAKLPAPPDPSGGG
jgi:hypothetical protein